MAIVPYKPLPQSEMREQTVVSLDVGSPAISGEAYSAQEIDTSFLEEPRLERRTLLHNLYQAGGSREEWNHLLA